MNGRLSAAKQRLLASRRGAGATVPRRDPGVPVQATHQQRALWFLDRYLGPGANSAYNLHHALRLRGELDTGVLQECLRRVVARHDALRTTFVDSPDGRLLLRVAPAPAVLPLAVRPAGPDLAAAVLAEASIPFDLTAGPLFRAVLLRVSPHEHVLLLVVHHTVFDGASVELVMAELAASYAGREVGSPPIEFADWAAYTHGPQHRAVAAARLDAAVARLSGAPSLLDLPTDRPRGPRLSTAGDTVSAAGAATALREVCRSEGVTMFTAVLAAYQLLLSRWSGQPDVCVGMPVAGRGRAELAGVVGCFVATGVVRTKVDPGLTFRSLLADVASAVHAALEDADVPFEQLVARLRPDRATGHNPVFQVFLDVAADQGGDQGTPGWDGLAAEPVVLPVREAKFDLSLTVTERGDDFVAELTHRTDLFDTATAARFLDQFMVLLDRLTARPDVPVADVCALSEAEISRWRADGSGAAVDVPEMTLPQALAAAVAEHPDEVAVRAGDDALTYAELDRRATMLAHRLVAAGAGPGAVVAVAVPRSLDLAVALGAVLRAGAAYLPLDLDHPADRLRFVLDDARPACVLTTAASTAAVTAFTEAFAGVKVVTIGDDAEAAPRPLPHPHVLDAAYIIYTSGSTGRPKGVAVPHRGIINRLRWMQHAYGLVPGERVLQKTPTTFDVSVWELFWPLLEGATLVFAPPGVHRDPLALARLVARERITTIHFVPSMLSAFLEEPEAARVGGGLRRVLCSGEELPAATVARFAEVLPGVELHNLYGPTEASVDVTAWKCGPPDTAAAPPIGRPVWNTGARVLDDRLGPVPVGVVGELYLSGVQLALGYHRRPGLTAERFLPDPWGPSGSRMYRTGDLVRRRPDGAIVFLGRADHQVKLHGQRIELGEIEQVLRDAPPVAAAVVVVRGDRPGMAQLVAYVTAAPGATPDGPELVARMRAVLPAVMVPEEVVVLAEFPLTSSGKLDRKALPAPAAPLSPAKQRLLAGRRGAVRDARVELLCELFAKLLGLDGAGPDDDFFRLGGDSIGSIRLVSLARRAGLGFSERTVFEQRTPRALAAAAAELAVEPGPGAETDDGTGVVPLTPIMRWWLAGGGPITGFHQSVLLDLPPGAGRSGLVALLSALAARHGMLRARLSADGGRTLVVPPAAEVDVASWLIRMPAGAGVDSGSPGDGERALAAGRLDPAHRMVSAVWLDRGPDRPGQLLLAVHHLAVDGVSWRILLDDITASWDDVAAGRAVRLPGVPASFRTWANRLVRAAPERLAELDVWRRAFSAPEPAFGAALDPAADTAGTAGELVHEVEAGPLLSVVPDRFRAGVDHVLLCGLALAVRAWRARRGTPSQVLRVMVEGHGRHDVGLDLSRTVGWFTVRHVAVLDLTATDTAAAALRAVKEQVRALPDGGLGYGLLRYLTDGPLATLAEPEVAFNYLGRFQPGGTSGLVALDGGIPDATPLTNALDVTAVAFDHAGGARLRTTFTWAPGVLDEPSVRELAELWAEALITLAGLADATDAADAAAVTASDVFVDMDQDELDTLRLELESDWGVR